MNNTRKLVESALMSALVGLFVILNRQTIGLLEGILFLLPLPMVFLSYKYDVKTALMATVGSLVLTLIFSDIPTIFTVFIESVIGIVYGSGLRKEEKSSTLLFKTISLAIFMNFITLVLFASFFGYDIVGEIKEIQDIFTSVLGEENISSLGINLKAFIEVIMMVSILLTGILEGYLTHISSRLLLSRLKFKISKPTPIFLYSPNIASGYIAIFASLLFWVSIYVNFDNQIIQYVLLFIGLVGYIYLVGYGAIGAIVMIRAYMPRLKIIGALFVVFAIFFLNIALMLFGFIYITTDIRERTLERIINDSQNRSNKI